MPPGTAGQQPQQQQVAPADSWQDAGARTLEFGLANSWDESTHDKLINDMVTGQEISRATLDRLVEIASRLMETEVLVQILQTVRDSYQGAVDKIVEGVGVDKESFYQHLRKNPGKLQDMVRNTYLTKDLGS